MVQEIVTLCDVCGERAEPVVLAIGRTERRVVVDLCPTHDAETVEPVRELLTSHGRPIVDPEPAPPPAAVRTPRADKSHPYRCLVCDMPSKSAAGIAQHYSSHHGMSTTGEIYGHHVCPLCGHDLGNAAALGTHTRAAHPEAGHDHNGVMGGAHWAYLMAERAGDPHGEVSAARERLRSRAAA